MKFKLFAFTFLLSATSVWAQDDSASKWLGLVELENQFPLALNHSSLRPQSPDLVAKNEWMLRATETVSNSYILVKGKYIIDGEYRVANLSARRGITDKLDLSINLPLVWRGGGSLDHFVDQFHQTFNLPRGDRPGHAENQFAIFGVNKDKTAFSVNETGLEVGDVTLTSRYKLDSGKPDETAWSALAEVRLPTAGQESYGQDSVDLTAGILGAHGFENLRLYWGGAYLFFGDTQLEDIEYEQHHLEGFVGAEYLLNQNLSLNAAFYGTSALISSIQKFPRYSTYLDTGVKYRVAKSTVLELLLRENPDPSDSTADFSVLFGVSTRAPF